MALSEAQAGMGPNPGNRVMFHSFECTSDLSLADWHKQFFQDRISKRIFVLCWYQDEMGFVKLNAEGPPRTYFVCLSAVQHISAVWCVWPDHLFVSVFICSSPTCFILCQNRESTLLFTSLSCFLLWLTSSSLVFCFVFLLICFLFYAFFFPTQILEYIITTQHLNVQ